MDALREQVMVNQFIVISGCRQEQAQQFLQNANWHFEASKFTPWFE